MTTTKTGPIAVARLSLLLSLMAADGFGAAQSASAVTRTPAATIALYVDASDTVHRIYHVREKITSASSGDLTLLYPEWEPASHAPTAWAGALAGLVVEADGRRLPWRRDLRDMHAFHVQLPEGVRTLDLSFDFLSPLNARQGPITSTPEVVTVPWHRLLLYPRMPVRDIDVRATLRLPEGMQPAGGIALAPGGGGLFRAAPVILPVLVDSPVYAARALRRIDLGTAGAPVTLDLLGADPAALEIRPDAVAAFKVLVVQSNRLFGPPPFDRYDFLAALSANLPGPGGIEHRTSSEDVLPTDFLTGWDRQLVYRDLLPHEFVHAWNGLARRPAGHDVPDYNTPVSNDLLWVYEGQTEFWARVLAARSGLRTAQQTLDALAIDAAVAQAHTGRRWRPLQDSTNDPVLDTGHSLAWRDWQRREDYYGEGVLLWLDVDTTLRARTAGRQSLDDFARLFFATAPDKPATFYAFDDVCAALDRLAPLDWHAWFRQRLDATDDDHLLDGLRGTGYDLVFTDTPSEYFKQTEADEGGTDLTWSIGLVATQDGVVRSVSWNGPAFAAGLNPGDRVTAVNGTRFTPDLLVESVRRAASVPVVLTVNGRNYTLAYRGTLRYPRLIRRRGTPDRLADLLRPLS